MKQVRTATAFALVLRMAVASATAEDKTSEQQEMSAEHKAMMEAWEKAAKPGPQHQWLAGKVGKWEFAGKFWMDPTKPPTESIGTVERELMLGGRVFGGEGQKHLYGQAIRGVWPHRLRQRVQGVLGHLERQHGHRDHVEHRPVRRQGRLHPHPTWTR